MFILESRELVWDHVADRWRFDYGRQRQKISQEYWFHYPIAIGGYSLLEKLFIFHQFQRLDLWGVLSFAVRSNSVKRTDSIKWLPSKAYFYILAFRGKISREYWDLSCRQRQFSQEYWTYFPITANGNLSRSKHNIALSLEANWLNMNSISQV